MLTTMRAIVLPRPVSPDQLTVSDVPVPDIRPGWVRIRVKAFGVNESEVTSRKGNPTRTSPSPASSASKASASLTPPPSAAASSPARRWPP
jgi:NADPH:quinone reductase-like Zn-dependent oxidoreductase